MIQDIQTRPEFDMLLRDALNMFKQLVQDNPADKTIFAVHRQLEAIQGWTAGGNDMTEAQKKSIVMGLQAQRELMDFVDEKDLVISLHNYILLTMPTARAVTPP
jgi:hypothetical protein